MADIDIVPKRHSYTWMWVLLAILVAAFIIWMLAGGMQSSEVGSVGPVPSTLGATAIASAV